MAEKSGPGHKDAEYWKNVASKLAITLAIVILASGLAGSWMNSEKLALDGCREARKNLKNLNTIATKKIGDYDQELKEYKKKVEKLEQQVLDLQLENADLKTRLNE